jgi:hypothetical protein
MYDFADREHAAGYLTGSIVKHGGMPTLIHAVDWGPRKAKLYAHHERLNMEEGIRADPLDQFDFTPFRLGMINFKVDGVISEACWVQRVPARRWKVGITREGLTTFPVRQADDNFLYAMFRNEKWWAGSEMFAMLQGNYPTLDKALNMIGRRKRCSIAFSPNFAVTGERELFYRHNAEPVGNVEGREPWLRPDYADLCDVLKEDLR